MSDTLNIRVFQNDKERLKVAVMDEAKTFCEMIDCIDEPIGLDSTTTSCGIKVRIEATVE